MNGQKEWLLKYRWLRMSQDGGLIDCLRLGVQYGPMIYYLLLVVEYGGLVDYLLLDVQDSDIFSDDGGDPGQHLRPQLPCARSSDSFTTIRPFLTQR